MLSIERMFVFRALKTYPEMHIFIIFIYLYWYFGNQIPMHTKLGDVISLSPDVHVFEWVYGVHACYVCTCTYLFYSW